MYIIGILLLCIFGLVTGPIDVINSFQNGRIALAILQIIITILLAGVAIIIFIVREQCGDFELDINERDQPLTMTLKNIGGYALGFAIILVIVTWFCTLGGII